MRDIPGELARARFLRDYYTKLVTKLETEIAGVKEKGLSRRPSGESAAAAAPGGTDGSEGGSTPCPSSRAHGWLKVD